MAFSTALVLIVIYFVFLFMTMVAHEYAHAWMAHKAGDYTAEAAGRMTANPLAHIDPFWTIIMPIVAVYSGIPLVCGPKPVPINPYNFRSTIKHYRLVSVAGVLVNFIIVVLLSFLLQALVAVGVSPEAPVIVVSGMVMISNVFLMLFNLLPIPPLDGSRIIRTFLPGQLADLYDRMDRYGIIILIVVINVFRGPLIWLAGVGLRVVFNYILRFDPTLFRQIWQGYEAILRGLGVS